jgi:N-acetylglucosamine-6-phosphate deacetylase
MLNDLLIQNAQVPGFPDRQQIDIQHGQIAAISPMPSSPAAAAGESRSDRPSLDVGGDWISLGGIDLQINGALGLPFPELHSAHGDQMLRIGQYLWEQGIDGFLPTIVTTSMENIQRSLAAIAQFQEMSLPSGTATILGVHLEGPFLNPQKRGAHPQDYLLPLTMDQVKQVLGDYSSLVKVMTLAPEMDPTGTVIPYLRSQGITVSLGHSLATAAQAQIAFAQGATMITHAFNAMPPLHHREPGLLGAAITHPQVHCGLIADGQHVAPMMIDILLRATLDHPSPRDPSPQAPSQPDSRVFLVSDALSPLGLPDGKYPWDSRQIEVKQGTAHLPDGTLSGTTRPLLVGVQNLVQWGICSIPSAIALATQVPRTAIGLSPDYIHQPAHLLRWHQTATGELQWQRL